MSNDSRDRPISVRRRRIRSTARYLLPLLLLGVALALGGHMLAQADTSPWIASDQRDYPPGATVTLTGGNWQAGEQVNLAVNDSVGSSWSWSDSVTADSSGNITDQLTLSSWFVATYNVTATGASGDSATTTFTDAAGFTVVGTDATQHQKLNQEQDLGNVAQGISLNIACPSGLTLKATGLGSGQTVNWSFGYGSAGTDNTTLAPLTTFSATSGQLSHSSDTACEGVSISTGTLTVGTTYHGMLALTYATGGTVTSATEGDYYFKFTVTASPAVTPTLSTNVQDGNNVTAASFPLATSVHDYASLTTTNSTTPAGTATFTLYVGSTCANRVTAPGTVLGSADTETLSNGAASSAASGALHAGSYYYLVTYASSDTTKWNNITTADCEDFAINTATPKVDTVINLQGDATNTNYDANNGGPDAPLASAAHDLATVTGVGTAGFSPAGTVDYTFYSDGTCDAGTNNASVVAGWPQIGVALGTASQYTAALHAGSYSFKAYYNDTSGDYSSAGASCERLVVDPATPGVSTAVHLGATDAGTPILVTSAGVPLASTVHDSATVTGIQTAGFNPTGSVSFAFYPTGDCSGGATDLTPSAATLSGSADPQTIDPSNAAGPLHAGPYSFKASFTSSSSDYTNNVGGCESFTVNKATPSVATAFENAANQAVLSPFALASTLHDAATVTGIANPPDPSFNPSGTVDFTFYGSNTLGNSNTGTCTDPTSTGESSASITGGVADGSSTVGPLHAGGYAFEAYYEGSSDYTATPSACEPLTVSKASSTTTTHVYTDSADQNDVTNGYVYVGSQVHDSASVTGISNPPAGFSPTGTVNYSYFTNGSCTPPAADTNNNVPLGTDSKTETITSVGSYCFQAQYSGSGDYNSSTGANEPFSVVPTGAITNGSCTFDYDTNTAGNQFHLIYTPDQNNPSTWKMNASNPGQFFYDGFYIGKGGTTVTLTVPYPFVTQGAVPVQIYSGYTYSTSGGQSCYTPVGSPIATSSQQIALSSYSSQTGTTTLTFTIPTVPGFAFFTVHMDYGLKIEYGCTNGGTLNATCTSPNAATINNLTSYTFSGPGGTATIQNENIFKKDPGIGGLVAQSGTTNPVANAQVKIYDSNNNLLGTATTDQDGWYMWSYKYTGKAATFVVKAPTYNQSQSVTLKSNGFLVVSFSV